MERASSLIASDRPSDLKISIIDAGNCGDEGLANTNENLSGTIIERQNVQVTPHYRSKDVGRDRVVFFWGCVTLSVYFLCMCVCVYSPDYLSCT